jgi:hypothetical protein
MAFRILKFMIMGYHYPQAASILQHAWPQAGPGRPNLLTSYNPFCACIEYRDTSLTNPPSRRRPALLAAAAGPLLPWRPVRADDRGGAHTHTFTAADVLTVVGPWEMPGLDPSPPATCLREWKWRRRC